MIKTHVIQQATVTKIILALLSWDITDGKAFVTYSFALSQEEINWQDEIAQGPDFKKLADKVSDYCKNNYLTLWSY